MNNQERASGGGGGKSDQLAVKKKGPQLVAQLPGSYPTKSSPTTSSPTRVGLPKTIDYRNNVSKMASQPVSRQSSGTSNPSSVRIRNAPRTHAFMYFLQYIVPSIAGFEELSNFSTLSIGLLDEM